MKRLPSLSRISLAVAAAVFAQSPVFAQTLKDAVDQTVQTNPDVRQEANQRLANEEAVKGARGGFFPKVDVGGGYGREWSKNATTRALSVTGTPAINPYFGNDGYTLTRREANATLSQMLFDGFGVSSEVDRNKSRVESAAYKTAGAAEYTGLRAVEAYLNVLRNRDLVRLTKANVEYHLKVQDQISVRSGGGVGRKSDQEQVDARVGLAKANLVSAEANLRDVEVNYLRTVGAKPGPMVRPNGPTAAELPKTEEEALKIAVENHPILKSATADVKAADYQREAAKSFMYPRFDAELGYGNNNNYDGQPGPNDEKYAMLRARWNLFKGGSDYARIKETGYLTSVATEIANRTRRQVEESVGLSWNTMYSAQNALPDLRLHFEKSVETRNSYSQQFNLGQRTLLDLLDSENEAFTAEQNYISRVYLEVFARYRLLADMGQLLSHLGVTPPEESLVVAEQR